MKQITNFKKDEFFSLIMKAIAIFLFIRSIILLPKVFNAIYMLIAEGQTIISVFLGEATIGSTMMVLSMGLQNYWSDSLIFFSFLLIGRDLLNGGHLIKKVLNNV
jgi:hypothetical protein